MHSTHLNEHDANQGAQSSGEFLGMTGNSGWYLLGSAGATILMVIVLWGILGVSLLLCLFVGLVLCALSVTYVFTLKNNKPEHYDTDFFESAFVEAGVVRFVFGPRGRRPVNPFAKDTGADAAVLSDSGAQVRREREAASSCSRARGGTKGTLAQAEPVQVNEPAKSTGARAAAAEPMVARSDYERVQEQLSSTEEMLEEALAGSAGD
jgi:hypothetical protein